MKYDEHRVMKCYVVYLYMNDLKYVCIHIEVVATIDIESTHIIKSNN